MTFSPRTFVVGPDDTLYRLGAAKFAGMLDDPESYRLSRFSGQRVRMVEAIVELRDRVPCGVVRLVYQMLGFDAQGRFDRRAFERQLANATAKQLENYELLGDGEGIHWPDVDEDLSIEGLLRGTH